MEINRYSAQKFLPNFARYLECRGKEKTYPKPPKVLSFTNQIGNHAKIIEIGYQLLQNWATTLTRYHALNKKQKQTLCKILHEAMIVKSADDDWAKDTINLVS